MRFGHSFGLGLMHLNCILHDLFRDTPLDHIRLAQICAQITLFCVFGHIWHICRMCSSGNIPQVKCVRIKRYVQSYVGNFGAERVMSTKSNCS